MVILEIDASSLRTAVRSVFLRVGGSVGAIISSRSCVSHPFSKFPILIPDYILVIIEVVVEFRAPRFPILVAWLAPTSFLHNFYPDYIVRMYTNLKRTIKCTS